MKRLYVSLFGLAALAVGTLVLPSVAQEERKVEIRGVELQGKIIRTGNDQFVIQTSDNKEVILFVNPQTKYVLKDKPLRFTDVRVGGNVRIAYVREGDRYIVSTVNFVEATAPQPEGTVIEGEVIRVVGPDQVIVRTAGNKEVIVFVDPKTTYLFEEKPGQFIDIRPGANLSINYDVREKKNVARRIVGPIRRR